MQNIGLDNFENISQIVINNVKRSSELLVFENAFEIHLYSNEPYILENQVKSIICIPIKNFGESFAFLYLENRFITGAFTKVRIEILQVIAMQTAISLQNAMLFEKTTILNKDLTQEIDIRKKAEADLKLN